MARHGQLIAAGALALFACREKSTPVVVVDAAPPFRKCTKADAMPFFEHVEQAHADRERELRQLLGILENAGDTLVSIGRMPSCVWPDDVNERVAMAEADFITRAKLERGTVPDARTAGCEEDGQLVVGFTKRVGRGDVASATYKVDRKKATRLGDGFARAHVDLDGDGKRDVVWAMPTVVDTMDFHVVKLHFEVRFATARIAKTTMEWHPPGNLVLNTGAPLSEGGVPNLNGAFALVLGGGRTGANGTIEERLRWNGKALIAVEAIPDEDFEARVKKASDAELAIAGPGGDVDGGIINLKRELDRCSKIVAPDPKCLPTVAATKGRLVTGGFSADEADEMLRDYLGWPCPPVPDAGPGQK